jgi:hypothetical protein
MPTTLPSLTETIDNAFLHTWYEIRPEAIDNILDATVVSAALREKGCFKTQSGGRYIERTIKYGKEAAASVVKGDIFPQGETELETAAMWKWKYIISHVQRSIFDDQINNGPSKIKDLVNTRITAARDALTEKLETDLLGTYSATAETTDKTVQGLNELIPPYASRAAATYGLIARSNSWWVPNYKALTANPEVNLLSDMKNLYNTCTKGIAAPNLIITDQTLFELYEDFALDISQIVKDENTHLADLGFDVLRFKGKPLVWTDSVKITYSMMLFLNTDFIEVVYDPRMWFAMGSWKDIPLQGERIAHILSAMNVIGTQPRRHGRLYAST